MSATVPYVRYGGYVPAPFLPVVDPVHAAVAHDLALRDLKEKGEISEAAVKLAELQKEEAAAGEAAKAAADAKEAAAKAAEEQKAAAGAAAEASEKAAAEAEDAQGVATAKGEAVTAESTEYSARRARNIATESAIVAHSLSPQRVRYVAAPSPYYAPYVPAVVPVPDPVFHAVAAGLIGRDVKEKEEVGAQAHRLLASVEDEKQAREAAQAAEEASAKAKADADAQSAAAEAAAAEAERLAAEAAAAEEKAAGAKEAAEQQAGDFSERRGRNVMTEHTIVAHSLSPQRVRYIPGGIPAPLPAAYLPAYPAPSVELSLAKERADAAVKDAEAALAAAKARQQALTTTA